MPKIDTKSQTITWDWEDWLAGLHPQYGVSAGFIQGSYAEISFNPFRYLGYACPGENPIACTNSDQLNGLITAIEPSTTTGRSYAVGGSKIYEVFWYSTSRVDISIDPPYPIEVSKAVMNDIVRYNKASDGTEYMFYSYKGDGTAGDKSDIGRLTTSNGTNDTSYWITTMSGTTLTDDVDHPLIVGDDDVLYIGDKNIVRGLDGADGGTMISVALTLPKQYTIRGFVKLDNNTLVIVANNNSTASNSGKSGNKIGVFFWNYLDLDPYKSKYLDGACGSVFNYNGTFAMIISSISPDLGNNYRNISIIAWDGSEFRTLPQSQLLEKNLPLLRGVEVIESSIYFLINGTIYCYGSPFVGIKSRIHKIYSSGYASGALKTIYTGTQLASFTGGTPTQYYLFSYQGGYSTATWQGTNVDLYFPMRKKARIKRMRVEFKDTATGGRALQVSFYNSAGTLLADMFSSAITVVSTGSLFLEKEYAADDDLPSSHFESMYPLLTWSTGSGSTACPIVKRIIVEYELVNI